MCASFYRTNEKRSEWGGKWRGKMFAAEKFFAAPGFFAFEKSSESSELWLVQFSAFMQTVRSQTACCDLFTASSRCLRERLKHRRWKCWSWTRCCCSDRRWSEEVDSIAPKASIRCQSKRWQSMRQTKTQHGNSIKVSPLNPRDRSSWRCAASQREDLSPSAVVWCSSSWCSSSASQRRTSRQSQHRKRDCQTASRFPSAR